MRTTIMLLVASIGVSAGGCAELFHTADHVHVPQAVVLDLVPTPGESGHTLRARWVFDDCGSSCYRYEQVTCEVSMPDPATAVVTGSMVVRADSLLCYQMCEVIEVECSASGFPGTAIEVQVTGFDPIPVFLGTRACVGTLEDGSERCDD